MRVLRCGRCGAGAEVWVLRCGWALRFRCLGAGSEVRVLRCGRCGAGAEVWLLRCGWALRYRC